MDQFRTYKVVVVAGGDNHFPFTDQGLLDAYQFAKANRGVVWEAVDGTPRIAVWWPRGMKQAA